MRGPDSSEQVHSNGPPTEWREGQILEVLSHDGRGLGGLWLADPSGQVGLYPVDRPILRRLIEQTPDLIGQKVRFQVGVAGLILKSEPILPSPPR
ncbi:MAG: hypothetical protein HZB27_01975 [Meiothermus silvanus]|nr:hypothetical protein [Allomeiothermus silvanus]